MPHRLAEAGPAGAAALFAESHLWATLTRVFLGFLIGAAPGILLGVVMGMSGTVRTMIDATLSAFYYDSAIRYLLDFLHAKLAQHRLLAVGHRVVHGGLEYEHPVRIDGQVLGRLEKFIPLAPLHQPHNLAAIRALRARAPGLLQVACFDTSFHRTAPTVAQAFALPPAITDRGVRRYGFHGLSYEYVAGALPQFDAAAAHGRVVVAHLGNGASMCAMAAGRSVTTTMGFTAVDGLPMGTRTGALDPGVVLYLMDELKMDARAIEKLLYKESGLLGVSACPPTCGRCWRAMTRGLPSRWSSSATASTANWGHWRPRWAGSMRWCSPATGLSTTKIPEIAFLTS